MPDTAHSKVAVSPTVTVQLGSSFVNSGAVSSLVTETSSATEMQSHSEKALSLSLSARNSQLTFHVDVGERGGRACIIDSFAAVLAYVFFSGFDNGQFLLSIG